MSGFGLIGALGGVGASLQGQAYNIQKNEDRDAEFERTRQLQDWLMQQREQYAIRAEGRADAAEERRYQKDRARLPEKIEDAVAVKKGVDLNPEILAAGRQAKLDDKTAELDWTTQNMPKIASNKHAEAEAGITSLDRQRVGYEGARVGIAQQQFNLERDRFQFTKDAELKLPAAVKMQVASYADGMKSIETAINKATGDGSLTPEGERKLIERRAVLQAKMDDALSPYMKSAQGGRASGLPSLDVVAADGAVKTAASAVAPTPAKATAPAVPQAQPVAPDNSPMGQLVSQIDGLQSRRDALKQQADKMIPSLSLKAQASLSPADRAARRQSYDALMAEISSINDQLNGLYDRGSKTPTAPRGLISTASR